MMIVVRETRGSTVESGHDAAPRIRASRRSITTIALGFALVAGGCGGEETQPSPEPTPPPAPAEAVTPLPGDFTPVDGGTTYTTQKFKPAMRITPPERGRWSTDVGDTPEHFGIQADFKFGYAGLGVHRITRVYDPKTGGVEPGDMVPFKGDFAAWLAGHPHLRTSDPEPVEVLGRSGVQIDVTTRSSPPRIPAQDCGHVGANCVPLFWDGVNQIVYGKLSKGRFIVVPLEDGGQLVVEQYVVPAAAFPRALAVLRPALESLELAR